MAIRTARAAAPCGARSRLRTPCCCRSPEASAWCLDPPASPSIALRHSSLRTSASHSAGQTFPTRLPLARNAPKSMTYGPGVRAVDADPRRLRAVNGVVQLQNNCTSGRLFQGRTLIIEPEGCRRASGIDSITSHRWHPTSVRGGLPFIVRMAFSRVVSQQLATQRCGAGNRQLRERQRTRDGPSGRRRAWRAGHRASHRDQR